jgi:hypothetical protein
MQKPSKLKWGSNCNSQPVQAQGMIPEEGQKNVLKNCCLAYLDAKL